MGMPLSLAAFSLHRVGSPPHGGSASSESSDGAVSLPSLSGLSASLSNQVRRGASCAQCRRLVQVPRREIFLVLQPDRRCRSSAWRFGCAQSSANAPSIDLFTDAHCAKENPLACLSGPVLLGPGHAVQMAALDASRATSGACAVVFAKCAAGRARAIFNAHPQIAHLRPLLTLAFQRMQAWP